jgi:hypothetical protein
VRAKARISRLPDGRWAVVRPVFGFASQPDHTVHDSWSSALASLTEAADRYSGGGSFERAQQPADQLASIPVWTPLEY